jgi:hypothetical protein
MLNRYQCIKFKNFQNEFGVVLSPFFLVAAGFVGVCSVNGWPCPSEWRGRWRAVLLPRRVAIGRHVSDCTAILVAILVGWGFHRSKRCLKIFNKSFNHAYI